MVIEAEAVEEVPLLNFACATLGSKGEVVSAFFTEKAIITQPLVPWVGVKLMVTVWALLETAHHAAISP